MQENRGRLNLTLCLEQTLGHRAHSTNLEQATANIDGTAIVRVACRERGFMPAPWAVRGSLNAARMLRSRPRSDVTLFHTQSIGLFAHYAVRGGTYAMSVDATPLQMDAMGRWYAHRRNWAGAELVKRAAYRRVLQGAGLVVAWSDWSRKSLTDDYGVEDENIHVVHPGAPAAFFRIPRKASGRPTVLFVGGDFARKGGQVLLDAFGAIRDRADLVVVTSEPIPESPGLRVVRDATPGSPQLLGAYAEADIFCLPTYGDCTSVAIEEAMAAGLPVVTTAVGSNTTTVRDGSSGIIVPTGSAIALEAALSRLIDDRVLRVEMGQCGREIATRDMDAETNARRIVGLMRGLA